MRLSRLTAQVPLECIFLPRRGIREKNVGVNLQSQMQAVASARPRSIRVRVGPTDSQMPGSYSSKMCMQEQRTSSPPPSHVHSSITNRNCPATGPHPWRLHGQLSSGWNHCRAPLLARSTVHPSTLSDLAGSPTIFSKVLTVLNGVGNRSRSLYNLSHTL